jgi:RNA polymerase sigma-70 factor (ECF subfamily)
MEGSLEGWVRRIVVNTSLEFIRKQKLQWVNIEDADEPAESEVVLDHMNAKELLMIINKLPSGFKAVFNLYAIEGYNHREIGELLGITESTSKSQYSRAKSALVKSIKEIESTTKDIVKE